MPDWLTRKAATQKWDPLFYRGVPGMPRMPKPPRAITQWGSGGQPPDGAVATGRVYTDGSLRGRLTRMARAGWGIAVVDDSLRTVWELHGSCDDPYPSSIRAE
jgi:hypothetical protein